MKRAVLPKVAKALMLAGALLAINTPPLIARGNAVVCSVTVNPGQVCTVTTSCFLGVCHCVTVCCC